MVVTAPSSSVVVRVCWTALEVATLPVVIVSAGEKEAVFVFGGSEEVLDDSWPVDGGAEESPEVGRVFDKEGDLLELSVDWLEDGGGGEAEA